MPKEAAPNRWELIRQKNIEEAKKAGLRIVHFIHKEHDRTPGEQLVAIEAIIFKETKTAWHGWPSNWDDADRRAFPDAFYSKKNWEITWRKKFQ